MQNIFRWLKAIWQKLASRDEQTLEDWQRLEFRDHKPVKNREHQ
jgi:hypothetical protein